MTKEIAAASPKTEDTHGIDIKRRSKIQRILRKMVFLPYLLGLVWTCMHPVVSILTGEMKCRGWYLDESSIDYKFAETSSSASLPNHLSVKLPSIPRGLSNLCEGLDDQGSANTNLSCHIHGDYFQMATIVPVSNAVDPTEEAVVFVVPSAPSGDWTTSSFHYSILQSLQNLANPIATPWLAKTLLVVAPPSDGTASSPTSLDDVVLNFLDAYLGSQPKESDSTPVPPLPPILSGAILRNLVVFDIDDRSNTIRIAKNKANVGTTEFGILPHGHRGLLPNLDLVFLAGKLFSRTLFLNPTRHPNNSFLMHGYMKESAMARSLISNKELALDNKTKKWAEDLVDMGLFAYSMAMGPYPPHAIALDRDIDAITIRIKFEGSFYKEPGREAVQYMEYLLRSLSNLHERLHHSHTLYLMPSPQKFVSHIEYFLPNILILLPLAIRAFGLVLPNLERLDLLSVGVNLLITTSTMLILSILFASPLDLPRANTAVLGVYIGIAIIWKKVILSRHTASGPLDEQQRGQLRQSILQTLQFVSCVTAAYILAPIAFAHTSLSYLPSVLLTPLLAFPAFGSEVGTRAGGVRRLLMAFVSVATAPGVLLVPHVFPVYTPFVLYAYIPLHLQWLLLVISTVLG